MISKKNNSNSSLTIIPPAPGVNTTETERPTNLAFQRDEWTGTSSSQLCNIGPSASSTAQPSKHSNGLYRKVNCPTQHLNSSTEFKCTDISQILSLYCYATASRHYTMLQSQECNTVTHHVPMSPQVTNLNKQSSSFWLKHIDCPMAFIVLLGSEILVHHCCLKSSTNLYSQENGSTQWIYSCDATSLVSNCLQLMPEWLHLQISSHDTIYSLEQNENYLHTRTLC